MGVFLSTVGNDGSMTFSIIFLKASSDEPDSERTRRIVFSDKLPITSSPSKTGNCETFFF